MECVLGDILLASDVSCSTLELRPCRIPSPQRRRPSERLSRLGRSAAALRRASGSPPAAAVEDVRTPRPGAHCANPTVGFGRRHEQAAFGPDRTGGRALVPGLGAGRPGRPAASEMDGKQRSHQQHRGIQHCDFERHRFAGTPPFVNPESRRRHQRPAGSVDGGVEYPLRRRLITSELGHDRAALGHEDAVREVEDLWQIR